MPTASSADWTRAGIFSRRTSQTQEARVYSYDIPIRRKKRGYILTTDQSDTGVAVAPSPTTPTGRARPRVVCDAIGGSCRDLQTRRFEPDASIGKLFRQACVSPWCSGQDAP
eukprot:2002824-Pyramimonas_sp.AAC.1